MQSLAYICLSASGPVLLHVFHDSDTLCIDFGLLSDLNNLLMLGIVLPTPELPIILLPKMLESILDSHLLPTLDLMRTVTSSFDSSQEVGLVLSIVLVCLRRFE